MELILLLLFSIILYFFILIYAIFSNFFYNNFIGGFDMIRSGRDKIEKPEDFASSLKYCKGLKLDGLVVIGGDDSNTNACLLANYFKE